jgi:hypothetical protein
MFHPARDGTFRSDMAGHSILGIPRQFSWQTKGLQDTELGRRYGRWEMKEINEAGEVDEIKEAKRRMGETSGIGGAAIDKSRPMLA